VILSPDTTAQSRSLVSWRVDATDHWRVVTLLALAGLAVAIALATAGLPPLDLHTPLHAAGIMTPGCGGTRSIRLAAMGQWGTSITYNPLGVPLLMLFIAMLVRAAIGVTTHRWYTVSFSWTRRRVWTTVAVAVVLIILLEARQQSIAPLLMQRQ